MRWTQVQKQGLLLSPSRSLSLSFEGQETEQAASSAAVWERWKARWKCTVHKTPLKSQFPVLPSLESEEREKKAKGVINQHKHRVTAGDFNIVN